MSHASFSRLSIPLLTGSLLLLGTPALAQPADADVTCAAAAVASTSAGVTLAQEADFRITVEDTTASCTDNRPGVEAGERITGAVITVPRAGEGEGTCGKLKAEITAHLAWVRADGGRTAPSRVEVELEIDGPEVTTEAELDGGTLDGYTVSGDLTNRAELQSHLATACLSTRGVTSAVFALTIGFNHEPGHGSGQ
ncbi:hypothetical protein N8J89_26180 [Crossiella sp. CA-258035]|uniref:hypothetical protein n=1 Tax=Crossiella sp. CA-258035 TaxID=2981138 RepID=UPI0024BCB63E|nr:hypothetical protein [Crossiella sp. CA-258035]WHT16615.1 hypothetical protein N8J89_26180 [Crossiella sp. CA-258035]